MDDDNNNNVVVIVVTVILLLLLLLHVIDSLIGDLSNSFSALPEGRQSYSGVYTVNTKVTCHLVLLFFPILSGITLVVLSLLHIFVHSLTCHSLIQSVLLTAYHD